MRYLDSSLARSSWTESLDLRDEVGRPSYDKAAWPIPALLEASPSAGGSSRDTCIIWPSFKATRHRAIEGLQRGDPFTSRISKAAKGRCYPEHSDHGNWMETRATM